MSRKTFYMRSEPALENSYCEGCEDDSDLGTPPAVTHIHVGPAWAEVSLTLCEACLGDFAACVSLAWTKFGAKEVRRG